MSQFNFESHLLSDITLFKAKLLSYNQVINVMLDTDDPPKQAFIYHSQLTHLIADLELYKKNLTSSINKG